MHRSEIWSAWHAALALPLAVLASGCSSASVGPSGPDGGADGSIEMIDGSANTYSSSHTNNGPLKGSSTDASGKPRAGSACANAGDCDNGDPCTLFNCMISSSQELATGQCVYTKLTTGSCATQCDIGGLTYASGAANPNNACQSCQLGATTSTSWTEAAVGTACAGGICDGTSCVPGCFIAGMVTVAGNANPANACQTCQPTTASLGWTSAADGTACAGGGCQGGTCTPGCIIGGTFYPTGSMNPGAACSVCQPSSNPSAWTPVTMGGDCGPTLTTIDGPVDAGSEVVSEGAPCTVGEVGTTSGGTVTYCETTGTGSTFPSGACVPAQCLACMQAACPTLTFPTPPTAACVQGAEELFNYFAQCGPDRSSVPMTLATPCSDPSTVLSSVEQCKNGCIGGGNGPCSFY